MTVKSPAVLGIDFKGSAVSDDQRGKWRRPEGMKGSAELLLGGPEGHAQEAEDL